MTKKRKPNSNTKKKLVNLINDLKNTYKDKDTYTFTEVMALYKSKEESQDGNNYPSRNTVLYNSDFRIERNKYKFLPPEIFTDIPDSSKNSVNELYNLLFK